MGGPININNQASANYKKQYAAGPPGLSRRDSLNGNIHNTPETTAINSNSVISRGNSQGRHIIVPA